jgi:hypothetical protein
MVSPLMRTPMAMMASKGPEEVIGGFREVRSVVDEPRRSPAPREEVVVLWIWEAEKSLHRVCVSFT